MDIRKFIMGSNCFEANGALTLSISGKFDLISNGEGGNRHLYVVRNGNSFTQNLLHIWIDTHSIIQATVRQNTYANVPSGIANVVQFVFLKHAKRAETWASGTIDCEYSDFSDVEKAISDLLLYAKKG